LTQRPQAGRSDAPNFLSADSRDVLDEGLEDALAMLHADRGNIQIIDPASGGLRIAVQAGFSDEFLEYFAIVDDGGSACGRTARQLKQTVIADVNTDSGFAPHREIAAASRFRAVQSTPLLDQHGQLIGVLSTHYSRPYRPSDLDLLLIRRFGELLGQAFEESLPADQQAAVTSSAASVAGR
jgi:GAF domain-containing protein